MSDEEFWNITPIEFQSLMDRWMERENRDFLRAGTIAASIYNVNRDPKKHPQAITAHDIFNLPKPEKPKPTPAQLKANAQRVFSLHNARMRRLERGKKKRA